MHDDQADDARTGLRRFWAWFTAMPTAIVLLLVLAAVSIVGTLVKDTGDPAQSIFRTPWYTALLAVIGLNLAACSLNRIGLAWRRIWHPDVVVTPAAVLALAAAETLTVPRLPAEVLADGTAALRHAGYAVTAAATPDGASLHAARGHFALWGPILTHVSLLVIFLGAWYGSWRGFEGFTMIVEGKETTSYARRGVPDRVPLGFTLALHRFSIETDAAQNPTAYRSEVEVHADGQPALAQTIDVNHPLVYRGISFYQADYGLVGCVVAVTDPHGQTVRVPLPLVTEGGRDRKTFQPVEGERLHVAQFAHDTFALYLTRFIPDTDGSALPLHPAVALLGNTRFPAYRGTEAWFDLGTLVAGQPRVLHGYTVVLERAVAYTGLSVSRNPGLPVIYTGFALLLLGVVASFYITYKVVRVCLVADGAGTEVVYGGVTKVDPTVFHDDFIRLRAALRRTEAGA